MQSPTDSSGSPQETRTTVSSESPNLASRNRDIESEVEVEIKVESDSESDSELDSQLHPPSSLLIRNIKKRTMTPSDYAPGYTTSEESESNSGGAALASKNKGSRKPSKKTKDNTAGMASLEIRSTDDENDLKKKKKKRNNARKNANRKRNAKAKKGEKIEGAVTERDVDHKRDQYPDVVGPFPLPTYESTPKFVDSVEQGHMRRGHRDDFLKQEGVYKLDVNLEKCDPSLKTAIYTLLRNKYDMKALRIFNSLKYDHLKHAREVQWELDAPQRALDTQTVLREEKELEEYRENRKAYEEYMADRKRREAAEDSDLSSTPSEWSVSSTGSRTQFERRENAMPDSVPLFFTVDYGMGVVKIQDVELVTTLWQARENEERLKNLSGSGARVPQFPEGRESEKMNDFGSLKKGIRRGFNKKK